jgi:hypothetical protein
MAPAIKSAFPKMVPKVDAEVRTKLTSQPNPDANGAVKSFEQSALEPSPPEALAPKPPAQKAVPMAKYKVPILLSTSDELLPEQGPGIIRSRLIDESRQIHVTLNRKDLLMGKALARVDTSFVKFAVALLLVEWCHFWQNVHEGRLVRKELRKAAELPQDHRLWWTRLASLLSKSKLLSPLDKLPIYGPAPTLLPPTELFCLNVILRNETQIKGWQPYNGAQSHSRREPTPGGGKNAAFSSIQ